MFELRENWCLQACFISTHHLHEANLEKAAFFDFRKADSRLPI
jgi:hypothetical protein